MCFSSNVCLFFIGVWAAAAQLPGGVQQADANDPYATNLLWSYGVPKYNLDSNYVYNSVPDMSTLKLRKQVVAGMNYIYDVHMVESTCPKSAGNLTIFQQTTCVARPGGRDDLCTFKLWDRAWLNQTEVTQMSCKPANVTTAPNGASAPNVSDSIIVGDSAVTNAPKPVILGGQTAADSSDPDVQSLLWNYIVKRYNSESNSIVYSVPDMVTVKRQVVAGTLYTFNVQMRESTCSKYQVGLDLYVLTANGSCEPSNGGRTDQCTVKIVEQLWLNRTEITNYKCNPLSSTDSPTTFVAPSNSLGAVNPK
jgi:hypothetical protein